MTNVSKMKKQKYYSAPILFDGVELKKGLTVYSVEMKYQNADICEPEFTILTYTFEEFQNWNGVIKDITKVLIDDYIYCTTDVGRVQIAEMKYFATTKKGAFEGYKQKKIDSLNSDHEARTKRVDEDLRWAFEVATELELAIQQERLALVTTLTQADMEMANH